MKSASNADNHVVWASLAEAMSTGVFGSGRSREYSELLSELLPVVARTVDGQELLAGTYDPETGTVWLPRVIRQRLKDYRDRSGTTVSVVDERGTAGSPDLHAGTVSLSAALGPGANLEIVGEVESNDSRKLGALTLRDSGWTQPVARSQAQVNFPFCPTEENARPK